MTATESKICEAEQQAKSYGQQSVQGFWDALQGQDSRGYRLYPNPTRDSAKRIRYGKGYEHGEAVLEALKVNSIAEIAA